MGVHPCRGSRLEGEQDFTIVIRIHRWFTDSSYPSSKRYSSSSGGERLLLHEYETSSPLGPTVSPVGASAGGRDQRVVAREVAYPHFQSRPDLAKPRATSERMTSGFGPASEPSCFPMPLRGAALGAGPVEGRQEESRRPLTSRRQETRVAPPSSPRGHRWRRDDGRPKGLSTVLPRPHSSPRPTSRRLRLS